jgi:sialidase-1
MKRNRKSRYGFLILCFFALSLSCKKIESLKTPAAGTKSALKRSFNSLGPNFYLLTDQIDKYGGVDIMQLPSGALLAVLSNDYYGIGSHTDLFKCLSYDGGVTWTTPAAMNIANSTHNYWLSNASFFTSGSRIFVVIQQRDITNHYEEISSLITYSDDNGESWSPVAMMLPGDVNPVQISAARNITTTFSGRILVPYGWGQTFNKVGVIYSDDHGSTWTKGANTITWSIPNSANFAEPTVAQLNDGRIMMVIRTTLGYVYKSYSSDNGITWSTAVAMPLESPGTAHAIHISPEGYILIVYDNSPGIGPGYSFPRNNLSFAVSYDYGESWVDRTSIIDVTDGHTLVMEPAVTMLQDGTILAAFYRGSLDALATDTGIIVARYAKSDIFSSISDYVSEDWNTLGSWLTTGSGTIGITGSNTLHLADNTNTITSVYKIQKVANNYNLRFRAQVQAFVSPGYIDSYSTFGTTYSDGAYRFMMKLESDGIYVIDHNGNWVQYPVTGYLNTKTSWHSWSVFVNNGTASIYMDDDLVVPAYSLQATMFNAGKIEHWTASSPSMPTSCDVDFTYCSIEDYVTEDWNALGAWTTTGSGTIGIAGGNTLHFADNTNTITSVYKIQKPATSYTINFRAQVQAFVSPGYIDSYSTFGTTYSDGTYRFMMKLESDGIYVIDYNGNWMPYPVTDYLNTKTSWHNWSVHVSSGTASIYMDGVLVVPGYTLETATYKAGKIEHWTASSPSMPTDCYVDYTYFTVP